MIDYRNRHYVTIAVRAVDGGTRPKLGDLVESKGILFSVIKSDSRWITLTAVIKNKVEYVECLGKFQQDTPINLTDWYPTLKDSDVYIKYEGKIVFIGHYEVTSFHP